MKLGGNRPPGDNPLLFSTSGTGSCFSVEPTAAGKTCNMHVKNTCKFRSNNWVFSELKVTGLDSYEKSGVSGDSIT